MRIPTFQGLLIPFLLTMVVAGGIAGCATDKMWVGVTDKVWVGDIITNDDESEVEKGTAQHKRILEQVGAYNDAGLSRYVDVIGEKIAASSDRPKLSWHFTVLDLETPNAFATQGGYVYITRGMLALLQSETELAAILSHETAHICARDTPHAERVGNMMGIGVLGVLVAAPALILFPQVAAAPAAAGMASMSRKNELNADKLGTEYLRRAGYPPESMVTTMALLAGMEAYERDQQKAAGRNPSGWWHRVYASHPTTETRQEKLAEDANVQASAMVTTPQPEFLAHLDSLEIGSSKFEGIPYKDKRYFSQWKIALEIPKNWFVYMNKERDQLWLVRPDRKAQLQVERTSLIDVDHPCETLRNLMTPSLITEANAIIEDGAPSCTGLVHKSISTLFGHHEQIYRAGVVAESKAAGFGYIFRGYAGEKDFAENDSIFLSMSRSIELVQATVTQPKPPLLQIRRAKKGDTFASFARNSRIPGNNAESLLRLLNRRYPDGEPQAGEFIKIIE
jgi:predicted Zn-dependent protease